VLSHLHKRIVPLIAAVVVAVPAALLLPAGTSDPASADAASVSGPRAHAAALAPAQEFANGTPAFQQALQVATAYWGGLPCQGAVTYEWTVLEPLTNARASWHNPVDAYGNAPQNFDCRVQFNTGATFDFPAFCSVLTHELGHLHGQAHDAEAGRLMSAIYTEPTPQCVAADPAAAARAQAAAAAASKPVAGAPTKTAASTRAATSTKTTAKAKPKAKKTAKRTSLGKKAKRGKRCVTKLKSGRRVKRCVAKRTPRRLAVRRG
jgi:hypothetical protein